MRRSSIFVLLVASAVLIAGCATTAKFEKKMETWVGASESRLLTEWGAPNRHYESDGFKYLTYTNEKTRSYRIPPDTAPTIEKLECNVTFVVKEGIIQNISWKGNNCVSE